FRGTLDLPLADEGAAQARATAGRLSSLRLAAIYASPLQRAARTAEIIATPHDAGVHTLPGLSSMDYGAWAGRLHTEVARGWPDLYRLWREDPFSVQIPDGESSTALRDRTLAAVREALSHHADGETIVLVSHQVVTKTLLCSLMDLPNRTYWRLQQDLCNINALLYEPGRGTFALEAANDTCHLDPMLPRGRGDGVRLLVVRHGQTAWNVGAGGQAGERFRGRTDLPLDDTGRTQAKALAGRLAAEPIDALYSSPLLRTRQTLEPLAQRTDLPIESHAGLIDVDYGRWQGLSHAQVRANDPARYARWRQHPGQVQFPAGGSLTQVASRLRSLLDELAASHHGETVVLAGHQIVNKVLACTLLGLDLDQIWQIEHDTAGVSVYQQAGNAWHVLRLNDTFHLESRLGDATGQRYR
ncbi:MAG: histidine phosphatase family protein, partial [Anaerolineae bacterium]